MMPRKDLSLAEKINLLNQIKCHLPGSHRRLAEITGVPKSTIARLLQNEQKLREEFTSSIDNVDKQKGSQKRKREGKDPDVEEALNQWFSIVTKQGVCVSGPILKEKAEELAKKLKHDNFKATDGWLSRWKCRHNIKFKKAHGEKNSADVLSVEKWKLKKIPQLLEKFCADEIYGADETGLFYRATPDGSLCYNYVNLFGSKKAMDRITVLCCTNMSGTDKKKLLVIGRVKPRCFKGLRMENLPVEYHANKNAWMTSAIFKTWLIKWDLELQRNSKKICLVLDTCTAHPQCGDILKNIQLEFLPANTTSFQPLDVGITRNFKLFYRSKLVRYILDALEENTLTSFSTAKEVSSKLDLLKALIFAADSWREISSRTIQNCFSHCLFKNLVMEMSTENESVSIATSELQKVTNYEEFEKIDNNVECHSAYEDCDEEIVENFLSRQQNKELDEESDDETFDFERVTVKTAKKCVEQLRLFFMQEENKDSPLCELDVCADFVYLQSLKTARQLC